MNNHSTTCRHANKRCTPQFFSLLCTIIHIRKVLEEIHQRAPDACIQNVITSTFKPFLTSVSGDHLFMDLTFQLSVCVCLQNFCVWHFQAFFPQILALYLYQLDHFTLVAMATLGKCWNSHAQTECKGWTWLSQPWFIYLYFLFQRRLWRHTRETWKHQFITPTTTAQLNCM